MVIWKKWLTSKFGTITEKHRGQGGGGKRRRSRGGVEVEKNIEYERRRGSRRRRRTRSRRRMGGGGGVLFRYCPLFWRQLLFFSNGHILIKFSSKNLFDPSNSIRKDHRFQKSYQLISRTKYYLRFWRLNINYCFRFFFASFRIQALTLLCYKIDIYFL